MSQNENQGQATTFSSKISLPVSELLKGQLHPTGYHKGTITYVTQKQSKDKQSMNYEAGFEYNVTPDEKREIGLRFNSKALGFMSPFLAAVAGLSLKEFAAEMAKKGDSVNFEWTPENFGGKKLQCKIENKPRNDNGQLKSEVTDYLPFDSVVPF